MIFEKQEEMIINAPGHFPILGIIFLHKAQKPMDLQDDLTTMAYSPLKSKKNYISEEFLKSMTFKVLLWK